MFLAIAGVLFASCENGFEDLQQDPTRPSVDQAPTDLLLANTIRQTQAALYNVQQGGDMGMCWAQLWSKVQYNDEERYTPRRGSIDNVWQTLGASVIYDAKVMSTKAEAEGNKNLQAIGYIIQANAFQMATDLFGPVPFSEAGVKGNLKPKFDSQKDVYDGILAMLTKADALLATGTGDVPATSDIVYGGDLNKWRRLANSLKLKALMRISNVRNVDAQVQALVTGNMLMRSIDDSANIFNKSDAAISNPISQTLATRLEYKVSSVLVGKLQTMSDPRLKVFAKPVTGTTYVGNVPGVASINYSGTSAVGTFYQAQTLPGVILSYAQQEMYLAEAALRGMIPGGVAESRVHLSNGVKANFLFNGLTDADATTYLGTPALNYTDLASGAPVIGTQMWLLLYGQGFEAWTEWRRTKFPALSPVANADITVGQIPNRLFYSTISENTNQENFAAAVASLDKGNSLISKLWWMN